MVGIAVLGCGRIGRIHARNLARHPRARLLMVFDVLAEAAEQTATELGVKIARSVDEVLSAGDVGGVLVATPTDTHVPLIMASVRAGKAVLCEKPVDLDMERARACWSEIAGNKPRVMIGFNRRFDPSFRALRERLQGGEIGGLELAVITSRDTAQLHAFGANLVDPQIGRLGDIDTCTISLRAKSGALLQINNSRRCAYGYDQRIEVFGSSGMLQAGNQYATSVESWSAERTAARDPLLNFFIERYRQAYEAEVNAFVASLEEGRPMSPDFTDALEALQLAVAAAESLRSGRVVDVGVSR